MVSELGYKQDHLLGVTGGVESAVLRIIQLCHSEHVIAMSVLCLQKYGQQHLDYSQHPLQLCRLDTLRLYALQAFGIRHRCLLDSVLLIMGRTAVGRGK